VREIALRITTARPLTHAARLGFAALREPALCSQNGLPNSDEESSLKSGAEDWKPTEAALAKTVSQRSEPWKELRANRNSFWFHPPQRPKTVTTNESLLAD
jgi:hypothetical protein